MDSKEGSGTTVGMAMALAQIENFDACVDDVRRAVLDNEDEPPDPETFEELCTRLEHGAEKFPPLYRRHVVDPFVRAIHELGPHGFNQVMRRDRDREREAGLMMDIAQAILQRGDAYLEKASSAFQEVVSDLYDGFLSVEDRKTVGGPSKTIIPPLVKWGRPEIGPYTWPISATAMFHLNAAIVSMPPAHARLGLLAWTSLAHETAGHDVMSANPGMTEELSEAVRKGLHRAIDQWRSEGVAFVDRQDTMDRFVDYWSLRVDEAASDVLGILNMGPMAALGIVGYLKAMNQAWGGKRMLRHGRAPHAQDPHPMDLMRGYLAMGTVRRLKYLSNREGRAEAIRSLMLPDEGDARDLNDTARRHTEIAGKTADVVAEIIMNHPLGTLSNHCLSQIQTWGEHDEAIVNTLGTRVKSLGTIEEIHVRGYYAAHVVAAAVSAALESKDADLSLIFLRMIGILKQMHDYNPSWGPLYVEHPSDLTAMRMYVPTPPNRGIR